MSAMTAAGAGTAAGTAADGAGGPGHGGAGSGRGGPGLAAGEAERLAAAVDGWREAVASTGPADHAAAEAGVRLAYRLAGLAEPEHVVWVDSPLQGAWAALLLTGRARPGQGPVERALAEAGAAPGAAGASVRDQVRTRPWERERRRLLDALGTAGWNDVWSLTGGQLWETTRLLADRIRAGVVAAVQEAAAREAAAGKAGARGTAARQAAPQGPAVQEAAVQGTAAQGAAAQASAALGAADPEVSGDDVRQALLDAVLGQHDAPWLAAFDGAGESLEGLAQVARAAGWWWPYEKAVVVAERPRELHRDESGRLDRGDGPALAFADGFALYAWRGMPVPAEFLDELSGLTPERIRREQNAELRRVMLEHFGYQRYLEESGARPLHRDETGILWRIDLPHEEPTVMVEVVNSTAEPDGTHRTYWLRVPPATRTAREGVAWTFGLDADAYRPEKET